jgi:hypothetical protein
MSKKCYSHIFASRDADWECNGYIILTRYATKELFNMHYFIKRDNPDLEKPYLRWFSIHLKVRLFIFAKHWKYF